MIQKELEVISTFLSQLSAQSSYLAQWARMNESALPHDLGTSYQFVINNAQNKRTFLHMSEKSSNFATKTNRTMALYLKTAFLSIEHHLKI